MQVGLMQSDELIFVRFRDAEYLFQTEHRVRLLTFGYLPILCNDKNTLNNKCSFYNSKSADFE